MKSNNKQTRLLDNAFRLFTKKGVKDTSIQEIVDNADVAKGTFYLYFKDKYELRDILIEKKSKKLFNNAFKALKKEKNITNLSDQVIFIIDNVLDQLTRNPLLLKFVSKNLSWGVFNTTMKRMYDTETSEENNILALFKKGIEDNNIKIEKPEVTLHMIIELTSSTAFNSILYSNPLPIKEYKPYLYDTIRKMIT